MNPAPGTEPALLPDASFPALKQMIIARTGHFYYDDKDDLLWERISRRMRARSISSCAGYMERLGDLARGEAEWAALETEITIGETYFFRYADQFTALRDIILPEIIARNADRRSIRVWSAGCSTGAEPYSVAILLRELLGERVADWRISIVGTDIDETALQAARAGIYGNWALRSTPQPLRDAYFIVQPDKRLFLLRPEYRSMVRFERHNLLSVTNGTSPLQFSDFDLVLCRNVLIYFHYETGEAILRGLRDCMLDRAWLLVGNAEPNPALASVFDTVPFPGATAYRRVESVQTRTPPVPWTHVPEPWTHPAPSRPAAVPAPRPVRREPVAAATPARASGRLDDAVRQLDELVHKGRLPEALDLCEGFLAGHAREPALHFRKGLYLHALGRDADAERALRAAIFLDRDFIAAHYQLGLLLVGQRRTRDAARALTNAARLSSTLPPQADVPDTDGMSALQMREGIALQLDFLGLRGLDGARA